MERRLQDLRELAMLETAKSDLDNDQAPPKKPNEIWCKQSIWKKFVQSESLYSSALAAMNWSDGEKPTVDLLVG